MKQPAAKLEDIAPAQPSDIVFHPDEVAWHLTLDQIESGTGNIIEKRTAPAVEYGSSTCVFDSGNVLYSKLRPYLNKVVLPREPGVATSFPLQRYHRVAHEKLTSALRQTLRQRRGTEIEKVFGDLKHNQGYRRLRLRGLKKIPAKLALFILSFNLRKLALRAATTQV